jgi:hypothetical protein
LSRRIGLDLATAREKVRVARATPDNEATLLEMALYATGAQLERICRGFRNAQMADQAPTPESRSVLRRLLPGGIVRLKIVSCPDEADLVLRALDRAREVEHSEEQSRASADRGIPSKHS